MSGDGKRITVTLLRGEYRRLVEARLCDTGADLRTVTSICRHHEPSRRAIQEGYDAGEDPADVARRLDPNPRRTK